MRIRLRSRVCKVTTGVLCILLLAQLAWKRNHSSSSHVTVDNERREAEKGDNYSSLRDVSEVLKPPPRWTSGSPSSPPSITTAHKATYGTQSMEKKATSAMIMDASQVKLSPKHPVVLEGHPVRLTCVAMQTLRNNASAAPYISFQFPPMETRDRRTIRLQLRPGSAVVSIRSVRRGHQGKYMCVMADHHGNQFYNTATLHVKEREEGLDEREEDHPEEENEMVEVGGLEIQAAARGDKEKVDKAQLLELRQHMDAELHIGTDLDKLLERGKFQVKQVEKYCVHHNLSWQQYVLPTEEEGSKALYRHMLINDKTRTLFSFVPKTGCTNLRILFFLVQGYIPLSQFLQSRDAVDQNRLEAAQFQESFFSRNDHQRLYALNNYYKFVMYRNPLDRLVSGFRSKVARFPLVGFSKDTPHFNWLRKDILLQTQPKQYQEFVHRHGNMSINITFSDFIDYWVQQPKEIKFDEHFRSIFTIAQPCRVRYDFYGNFKNFEQDSLVLIQKIKAKPQYLRQGYYGTKGVVATEELAPVLYQQLSKDQKLKVLQVLTAELDFYYHIFPEEVNVHKSILGISEDLYTAPVK